MAINPNRKRCSMAVTSLDGHQYAILTTVGHRTAVGGNSGTGLPAYPELRVPNHVTGFGVDDSAQKITLAVPDKETGIGLLNAVLNVPGTGGFRITGFSGEHITRVPD